MCCVQISQVPDAGMSATVDAIPLAMAVTACPIMIGTQQAASTAVTAGAMAMMTVTAHRTVPLWGFCAADKLEERMDQATMHERTETLLTATASYGSNSDQAYARSLQETDGATDASIPEDPQATGGNPEIMQTMQQDEPAADCHFACGCGCHAPAQGCDCLYRTQPLQEPQHPKAMLHDQGPGQYNHPVYPDPAEYHPTVAELEAGAAMLGAGCQEACHCGCHAPHAGCDCTKPRGPLKKPHMPPPTPKAAPNADPPQQVMGPSPAPASKPSHPPPKLKPHCPHKPQAQTAPLETRKCERSCECGCDGVHYPGMKAPCECVDPEPYYDPNEADEDSCETKCACGCHGHLYENKYGPYLCECQPGQHALSPLTSHKDSKIR
ncbi:hypothetical protein WJX74_007746 [Apatococcus lobatus]|uniref:Uncharacterized protein n=1 Tax=Apatococcus lobatus TaxID=904363 RepID=A0AAW1RBU4_9CHLO